MSFATVLPYALIVDGPQAFRWWGAAGDGAGAWAAAAAVEGGLDDGNYDAGASGADADAGDLATSLTSLALYLGVSGVLLFLHSAVSSLSSFSRCVREEPGRESGSVFVLGGR